MQTKKVITIMQNLIYKRDAFFNFMIKRKTSIKLKVNKNQLQNQNLTLLTNFMIKDKKKTIECFFFFFFR